MANILFLFLFIVLFPRLGSDQDKCTTVSLCKENGPAVKFPFRLKNHQPESCGYLGFELYCDKANETFLELPVSVSLLVKKIDYKNQVIQVYDPAGCLIRQLLKINLSATLFQFEDEVERFLADYIALKPARYSYADIKRITNQFKDKLGEGGYGTVYKGKLSDEIFVAIKVLNNVKGNGEEFINEVGTIGRIHHVHVVRLVGYCADGFR
ncbi:hypothetical protein LguiB_005788 [Lonicera macranthoides]